MNQEKAPPSENRPDSSSRRWMIFAVGLGIGFMFFMTWSILRGGQSEFRARQEIQTKVRFAALNLAAAAKTLENLQDERQAYPAVDDSGSATGAYFPGERSDTPVNLFDNDEIIVPQRPQDPFSPEGGSFRYFSDGDEFYLLASNGPDQDADIEVSRYQGQGIDGLRPFVYHSSNGLRSNGDIFIAKDKTGTRWGSHIEFRRLLNPIQIP